LFFFKNSFINKIFYFLLLIYNSKVYIYRKLFKIIRNDEFHLNMRMGDMLQYKGINMFSEKRNYNFSVISTLICCFLMISVSFINIQAEHVYDSSQSKNSFLSEPDAKAVGRGLVLYVGGGGSGNYTTIQEAINNASEGDSIFVFNGIYHENILIDKEINITGEQQENTIIDGTNSDSTVTINSAMVSFSSFTVQHGDNYGIFLDNAHGALIHHSMIKNNDIAGIYGASAIGCMIYNNTIQNNSNGIYLNYYSRFCNVFNNTIDSQSLRGIYFQSSYNNTIYSCILSNNNIGIAFHYCTNSSIKNMLIFNHSDYGIRLKESEENTIAFNQFFNNTEGIQLWEQTSYNIIHGNTIITTDNIAPFARDDTTSTLMNTSTTINVTLNDCDRDGKINSSSVTIINYPIHGTIDDVSNGVVSYTPTTGFNGSDTFTYSMEDLLGQTSNVAQVHVLVISDNLGDELNQQQDIVNRSLFIYSDWQMAQCIKLNAGTFTKLALYMKKTGNPPAPLHVLIHKDNISGEVVYSSSQPASAFTYDDEWVFFNDTDFITDPSIQYYIEVFSLSGNNYNCYKWGQSTIDSYPAGYALASQDGGNNWDNMNDSDFCFQIYKVVGIGPIAANDTYYTTQATTLSVSLPGVLLNDYDHDNEPQVLTALLENDVDHGALTLNLDGSFIYQPDYDFIGNDSFTYKATDGQYNSSAVTVIINVTTMKKYCINIPSSSNPSSDNIIYHNNLYTGTYNPCVFDACNNIWDNTSLNLIGGNYWSNYNEIGEGAIDADVDTIYDHPYAIFGGNNQDQYPLAIEWVNYDPLINFTWIPVGPETDRTIQFNDESIDFGYGTIVSWSWDFDDGNTSIEKNPVHKYNQIGIYAVSLTITDDDGNSPTIIHDVVISANPPQADFSWDPINATIEDVIQFTDLSTDDGTIVSWIWDFDDGNTSIIQHPTHQFASNGVFNVTLTVGDNDGAIDVITKPVNIMNLNPVAQNDSIIISENTPTWMSVLTNDYDPDGILIPSSIDIINQPFHGTIIDINMTTGEILYGPQMNYYGNDSFAYEISDDDGANDTAIVSVQIIHSNSPPHAENDSYILMEDTVFTIDAPGILENDSDPDMYPMALSAYLIEDSDHGIVTLHQNGSFSYEPDDDYYGMDSFIYQAFDGLNYSNNATVTLLISAINDPPFAFNDSYFIMEDTIFDNDSISVLDNDGDIDNSSIDLTAELQQNATKGLLLFNANGTFHYTPDANFSGIDIFTYRVSDGLSYSENATVEIEVHNINDPPVAHNDTYIISEDMDLIVDSPGVLANDTDVDSSMLSAINLSSTAHGVLQFNSDGSFEYIPNPNFYGFDAFTYQAFDGMNYSNTATVTIQVININEPPITQEDSYLVDEDTALIITSPGILGNDSDPDGGPNPLTTILIEDTSRGTLQCYENGSFMYLPFENYTGVDSFIYQAYDGADYSVNTSVTLTILNINDAPVAVDNLYTIDEDTILYAQAPGVLSNDYDAESLVAELTATNTSAPIHGNLTFNVNGSFLYEPDTNYYGVDNFTYQAFDGTDYSNNATVTIIINSVNDHPIAINESYTTNEDVSLSINSSNGVLANDFDPDASPEALTAVLIKSPLKGSINLSENGSFTYTPVNHFHGNDFFTYQAFDGLNYSNETYVNITVFSINDPPLARNDSYFTFINQSLNITAPGILENDEDADTPMENLTIILITNVTYGNLSLDTNGSFTYVPNSNFTGDDSFVYQLYDGMDYSNQAVVNITVITINIPPVANDDSYAVAENNTLLVSAPGVLANDTDPDGGPDALSVVLIDNVTQGTLLLHINGSFSYMPDENFYGIDSFTYQAFDGLNSSNIASVWITVVGDNIQPIAYNDSYITNEDTLLQVLAPGILLNDYDPDDGPHPLTAQVVDNTTHGILLVQTNGSFSYMPDGNYSGMDSFTYQAFDGLNLSDSATVWITITSDNLPPIAYNDSYNSSEDTLLQVLAPGVLENDADPDSGPEALSVVLIDDVTQGTLLLHVNGSFSYMPDANYSGMDWFSYQAFDGESYSEVSLSYLTIAEVNDPPIAINDTASIIANTSIVISVIANDYDIDGSIDPTTVTHVAGNGPNHGNITIDPVTGNVTYTPDIGYIGYDQFDYRVADDGGLVSNDATVGIDIGDMINQSIFNRGFPIRHTLDGDWAAAQSFIPTMSIITHAEIYIRKFGTPEFNLTVELRTDHPQGPILDTIVFSIEEIASSWQWLNLNFKDVSVIPGTDYFLVCPPTPSGVSTSFGYEWGYAFGNQYDDGSFWFTRDGGGLWRDLPSMYDFVFSIYGT
jgi:parallel beta-helix repeat protein/VCBS repeat-containing protein